MSKIFPNLFSVRHHGKIRCPDCQTPMTPYLCESAVIDKCDTCNGIWFDKNELAVFQRSIKKYDLSYLKMEEGLQENLPRYEISECPRCAQALIENVQGSYRKIFLQSCTKCRGQWLKAAQLIQLVDLLKLNQELAPEINNLQKELGNITREVEFDKKLKYLGDKYGGNLYDQAFMAKRPRMSLLSSPHTTNVTWILLALSFVGALINAFVIPWKVSSDPFYILENQIIYQLVQFCWHFFSTYGVFHFIASSVFLVLFAQAAEKKLGSYHFLIMVCLTPLFLMALKVINLLWDISGDPVGLGVVISGSMGALFLNHSDYRIEGGLNSYYYQVSAAFLTLLWFLLQFLMLGPVEWSIEWTSQCFTFVLWLLASLLVPEDP